MGIPYYFYVITRTYEGILMKNLPSAKRCQHFMLDYNGLIHPASAKYLKTLEKPVKDIEKGIMSSVWEETKNLVDMVQPEKTVQIYIDGVAPIAKMNQQRKRRFLSIFRKKHTGETSLWDSNAISPGTTFMTRLHASIRAHIRHSKDPYEFYFSSSDEVGEGEHKLFERMNRLYNDPSECKIIYGMDADLIMLSLMSHIQNIFLLRENQKVNDEYMYLHIDNLRLGILKDLHYNYGWKMSKDVFENIYSEEAKTVIESYVTMCFLLGNDFLPHPIGLDLRKGGLENLLIQTGKLWNQLDTPIVDASTGTIHWAFIAQILEILGQEENDHFFDLVEKYWNKKPMYETKEQEIDAYPLLKKDSFVYDMLFKVDRKKWRMHYYKNLFHCSLNDSKVITQSCDLYLKGILWTYQYYKRGRKDHTWYYPYTYAPTMRDLSNYLNAHISSYEELKGSWQENYPRDIFCDNIVQLISILPKESYGCLPLKYQAIMKDSKQLQYLYPNEYQLDTFMKSKLWECNPILPPLNTSFVDKVVKNDISTINNRYKI